MAADRTQEIYELGTIRSDHVEGEGYEHEARALPRADGGRDAWLALGGCFVLEALVW